MGMPVEMGVSVTGELRMRCAVIISVSVSFSFSFSVAFTISVSNCRGEREPVMFVGGSYRAG